MIQSPTSCQYTKCPTGIEWNNKQLTSAEYEPRIGDVVTLYRVSPLALALPDVAAPGTPPTNGYHFLSDGIKLMVNVYASGVLVSSVSLDGVPANGGRLNVIRYLHESASSGGIVIRNDTVGDAVTAGLIAGCGKVPTNGISQLEFAEIIPDGYTGPVYSVGRFGTTVRKLCVPGSDDFNGGEATHVGYCENRSILLSASRLPLGIKNRFARTWLNGTLSPLTWLPHGSILRSSGYFFVSKLGADTVVTWRANGVLRRAVI